MPLKIGDKVKFKRTGDEGIVRAILTEAMVEVWLEAAQLQLPVLVNDLELATANAVQLTDVPDFVPPNIDPELQLLFDPQLKKTGEVERYTMYLVNTGAFTVAYELFFALAEIEEESWQGKITPGAHLKLDDLFYDELNEFPSFYIKASRVETSAEEPLIFERLIKIKPKQFFANTTYMAFLDKTIHWYVLLESLDPTKQKKDTEDLKSYTQKNKGTRKKTTINYRQFNYTSTQEYAEFKNEIDLHIENLISSTASMDNAQIIRIQLQHFENFLSKAIRLGVSPVFVIHGIGKGRLKQEIAKRLIQNPLVRSYKNEYHPKYGWGATEIIL